MPRPWASRRACNAPGATNASRQAQVLAIATSCIGAQLTTRSARDEGWSRSIALRACDEPGLRVKRRRRFRFALHLLAPEDVKPGGDDDGRAAERKGIGHVAEHRIA